jgi:hypothetical protein
MIIIHTHHGIPPFSSFCEEVVDVVDVVDEVVAILGK